MKKHLFYVITASLVIFSVAKAQAQVTFRPHLKSPSSKVILEKSSSKVSAGLNNLSRNHSIKANVVTRDFKPVLSFNGMDKYIQLKGDRVLVDITVNEDNAAIRSELEKAGFKIQAAYGRIISGSIPVGSISQLEAITDIKFARPAYKPMHQGKALKSIVEKGLQDVSVKPVISQGDTAQRSYIARNKYKVNGKGVKVGILSDSYNNLGTDSIGVAHGELPGPGNPFGYKTPVKVLLDNYYFDGIDEGRGMAEIVHDVAPGAEIAFRTAFLGQADFANGILDLGKYGCKVITDDIIYYAEPFFQDGIIAQAVDEVKEDGVTFLSAAFNQSRQSYENRYHASNYAPLDSLFGIPLGTAHNFSGSDKTPIYFQPVKIPVNGYGIFDFQWDDPFFSASVGGPGAATDLDIWLFNATGTLVNYSAADNIANGDPFEIFGHFNGDSTNTNFYLLITKFGGPDPVHLKYINFGNVSFGPSSPRIPGIYAPAIFGHSKAKGAIATAAAWWLQTPAYGSDTPRVEYFSSVGGVPNYFNVHGKRIQAVDRKKPEITAPDGGNTSFFPPEIYFGNTDSRADSDTFPNFYGTSAAAPHAAAVAALMIEAQKLGTITPDQIKSVLIESAIDMNNRYTPGFDKGFDYNTGAGFITADKAVETVKFPAVYIKDLDLEAVCSDDPAKTLNWKISNPNAFEVEAHWLLSGFAQSDNIIVPPGGITFSTNTEYYAGFPIPNIVIIDWKDNLNTSHIDVAYSTGTTCGQEIVSAGKTSLRPANGVDAKTISAANIAEVYPNPATKNFKVYLSLANSQNADISIYSTDGKVLYQKVGQSKGVIDIDAANYKPGLYILKVRQGAFNKTFKVVKQ